MPAKSMRRDTEGPLSPGDAVAASFSVEILTGRDAFLALKPEWDALFARAGLPQQLFQRHAFLRYWCDHYLPAGDRLCLVVGRESGRLVMLWPLERRRRLGLELVRLMGAPVAQFGDVLVEPGPRREHWLERGWEALRRYGIDLVELRLVRADAALAHCGRLALVVPVVSQEAPFADLALRVAPDGPSLAYPARDRSNYRRRLRRLAERGEIVFAHQEPGPQAGALAEQAVAMKRDALAQHGIVAPAVSNPRFGRFFAALAAEQSEDTGLRLSIVTCDDRPVGIDLSFDCKGRSFGHVIASDLAFEREGLGRVLIHHAFASARARGNAIFDLLAPADPYKREHADGAVPVRDFTVPLSWRGQLACDLALPQLRPTLKAIVKRLPAGWVQRFARSGS
ncbi:Acetyltransferase involved in cellulose biosynthesis, CelD/BcsL family [Bosea lupini]|uniref:Acetyltransferase involved in cellulose biosynthesis, CelD/BcsL family n=1 Tax=Bosea lupini TaxID=1036779 RepID=A0A1H8A1Q8_9HYPH|nr:GNAT family N-acetyltransferase [Bosea lupini]SEM64531.1 Acetyltransferase involved in cellulose biosynthesis, CelD/BcsL family [Bosea lupini]